MIIAGIGSRRTPKDILDLFQNWGTLCQQRNIWVRSGHAEGADLAWEHGARDRCIVYLPWASFNGPCFTPHTLAFNRAPKTSQQRALRSIEQFHPAPNNLRASHRALMGRNYFQIMGTKEQAVDAVICWAPIKAEQIIGGTGQAIRIAQARGIPVFNLFQASPASVDAFLRSC